MSGEDQVYFTNSSTFHVAEAKNLFDNFAKEKKLVPEFGRKDLTISRPNVDLRVLSFDFEHREARFCRVSRMYEAKVSRLLRIKTALGRTISVTPDHPMFVVKDGVVRTRKAEELRAGDSVPIALDFPFTKDQATTAVIDIIEELSFRKNLDGITVSLRGRGLKEWRTQLDTLLRKVGVSASQRSHYLNYNYLPLKTFLAVESDPAFPIARKDLLLYPRRGRVTKIPAVIAIDSDFARLTGYYLAEGCRYDETGALSKGKTSRIIWTFRTDELEYIDDLCAILEKLGIRYGRRQTKTNAVQIRVSSQILGWIFREVLQAGKDSYSKKIPNQYYHLPRELSFEVLKGIVRGDGSLDARSETSSARVRFGSSSSVLFQQVLLLFQSLGYVPSTTTTVHTKGTVPFQELTIHGRTGIKSLKSMFSRDVMSKAEGRLAKYSEPAMEHYRSQRHGNFAAVKISKIDELAGDFSVYNFEVEGTHNYVTSGGIITHNCVGVPTVAGDIEFDESFERNCLVDVACVGLGRADALILGEAKNPGDVLVLVGGSTGRDGIKGATFASKNLSKSAEDDRSSVQVPDPFMKKLLLDSLLEAAATGLIRGMKDLGGGGLSTALSEVASSGGTGVDVDLERVRAREGDMSPAEIMTSESQERMLLMLSTKGSEPVLSTLDKYEVPYSVIGKVTSDGTLTIRWQGKVVARLPAEFVVKAPLIPWPSRRPKAIRVRHSRFPRRSMSRLLLSLLASPNIASKKWVYRQYDHEVGLRTVLRPGQADAALMRLPNGRLLAIKGDGNSAQVALDPYNGAAGCLAEACRNVVSVGAEPIAMVDHLQFGDPSDPEVYWSFSESIRGMADYCSALGIPVVGGKVSFYNEDAGSGRAIKPSPIALVVGLVDDSRHIPSLGFTKDASIVAVGGTDSELGGSEFNRRFGLNGGGVPKVNPKNDGALYGTILELIRSGRVGSVHDCSRGGLGVALSEMCAAGDIGADVTLDKVPGGWKNAHELLFSESHGRFLVAGNDPVAISGVLASAHLPHAVIGRTGGNELEVKVNERGLSLSVKTIAASLQGTIPRLMQ
ncbi:MAG: phosphoribosylformylglycinamidine synthase subunit PurL [Thaumarchaeota archaeon]|nr:phosphoribosylformylglycinamidine synthase subunit PurL [Nitrososphaerota archaeon]